MRIEEKSYDSRKIMPDKDKENKEKYK